MKKFLFLAALLSVTIWAGCSSDNGGPVGPGPTVPPRVVANTLVGTPAMDSANELIWSTVTKVAVDISSLNAPKLPLPESQNAPDSVYVQAISDGINLFLRIEYSDDSLNLLKNFNSVRDANLNFDSNAYSHEDQIYVMFAGLPNNAWDVWNWRALETAPAGLAEGYIYENALLVRDTGNQVVAYPNGLQGARPTWVHQTGPLFTGQILYLTEIDSMTHHDVPTSWSIGQIVPGYFIDSATGTRVKQPAYAQSRWDIFAVHSYNSSTNRLSVVLKSKLISTYGDDLDLVDSVKIKIGVLDDQDDLMVSGSRRGFTKEFWLIL